MPKRIFWIGLALFLAGSISAMQGQSEGVSRPPQDIQASPEQPAPVVEEITPASPVAPAPGATVTVTVSPAPAAGSDRPNPATPAVATSAIAPVTAAEDSDTPNLSDPSRDYGIVGGASVNERTVEDGTLFQVRMGELVSTTYTQRGAVFHATLVAPLMQGGQIFIPEGSQVLGHVTVSEAHKLARGPARLHIRPEEVVLPDGRHMMLHARVVSTDQNRLRVDSEGNILSRPQLKKGLIIAGAATGTGAVAGAVIAGPGGAAVGTIVGAGVGGTHMLLQEQEAVLPENALVTLRMTDLLPTTAQAE